MMGRGHRFFFYGSESGSPISILFLIPIPIIHSLPDPDPDPLFLSRSRIADKLSRSSPSLTIDYSIVYTAVYRYISYISIYL